MYSNRRSFLKRAGTLGAVTAASGLVACEASGPGGEASPPVGPLDDLEPMLDGVSPISVAEREARVEKAQRLMVENEIDAMFLDTGTSMDYFTGISWRGGERMFAAVIPANGDIKYVAPGFEEARARELITLGDDVRVWQEHESPYRVVAGILKDFGISAGRVAMEERVRFFLFDGVRQEAARNHYVSADPVTIPCRMYKTAHELQLMQKASDITITTYSASIPQLEEGMSPEDFAAITAEAHTRLGAPGGRIGASFAGATAFPHGSIEPQYLKDGDMVLMDGGCNVHGYRSDISRTTVFGTPTTRQTEIWNLEKAAQAAGFNAAQVGVPCEEVDIAARKVIIDAGFGPGYKVPGLPHRTGHGIGMDGHEWGNMVLGNKTPLAPGMCFSVEPMVAIYGEFGVRLEDCAYITEDGPKWFSVPSAAIDRPMEA